MDHTLRHRTRLALLAALATAVLACNLPSMTPAPTAEDQPAASPDTARPAETEPVRAAWQVPEHRIAVRTVDGVGEFYDRLTGEKFVPRGVNYVFVPLSATTYSNKPFQTSLYDAARTRADFARLAGYGYNTVRVFLDHCSAGPGCIGDSDNEGLNPAYLDNIADMMDAAHETGVYLLLTSNDLPDQGGYSEEANSQSGDTFAGYRNSYYLTPNAVTATRRYWRDLLTGLIAREAAFDAVLGWQLLNEQWMFLNQPPLSLTEGLAETTTGTYDMSDPEQKRRMVSEGLIYYIAQMREEILSHDPTALVTMGFFAPEIAAPDWYVDTAPLLEGADLDFFDFHAYPGGLSLVLHAEHFGMVGYDEKPIIMGEYGAFRHLYGELSSAARAVTTWVADSCELGFDGWLYWTYYPAGANVGDRTWGFTDEVGFLMDLLAPTNQPDPCVPVEVLSANLAYGRPVMVSAALPEEPPEFAVDESEGSQWGSGGDAPQWIEVDLEGAYHITEIRLLVAQYPEGNTVHRISVRAEDGGTRAVHDFRQLTRDGDWLVYEPDPPLENVQVIRIDTLISPSWVAWKEIQVLGQAATARPAP